MKTKVKYNRVYLGTIVTGANFKEIVEKEGRDAINFHNKHLRAYIKGKSHFTHGRLHNEKGEDIGPAIHAVKEKLEEIQK